MHTIYLITNRNNGKQYVGRTGVGIQKRWTSHQRSAHEGSPFPIHRALRKHGIDAFSIEAIEYVEEEESGSAEQYWIEWYGTFGKGYNATIGGDGGIGYKHSDSSKSKMRSVALAKGRTLSVKALKRSLEVRRCGISPEARKRMSDAQKRRRAEQPITPEFRERMRQVALKRPTKETRNLDVYR